MFTHLHPNQINDKVEFIKRYIGANNAADGSVLDSNANVSAKNVATLEMEIYKDFNIQVRRKMVCDRLTQLFGDDVAEQYLRDIKSHLIYVHDETSGAVPKPYCASISLYPFLLNGMSDLTGESDAPKHLASFCGSFSNLIFAVSAQFAGAIATVEFLMCFDHFARKDYGDDYLNTHRHEIENHLQHVVYTINQPAAARGYQSVFWNLSVFDRPYFEAMFDGYIFPDNCDEPKYESIAKLQAFFLDWFNKERSKKTLTFPVVTAAMLTDGKKPVDDEFAMMCAQNMAEGGSFFIYMSESADSLASCCRLRNEVQENTFSYTLGAGGVSTGSLQVITINMNRLVQAAGIGMVDSRDMLRDVVGRVHKYLFAYRSILVDMLNSKMLPVYDSGFISMEKQYLTLGINGVVEGAEAMGISATNNDDYIEWVSSHLKVIYDLNKSARLEYECMFNTEMVPAENLGVKNAAWDKESGFIAHRDCYNSYFYPVEDESINALDKMVLHGQRMTQYLDGGSALHLNLGELLSAKQFHHLMCVSARVGCNYFCTNVLTTICDDCGHISKQTHDACPECNSSNVGHAVRVIGYLKRIDSFSSARQREHARRFYHKHA